MARRRSYRWSFPTCTGLNAAFHLPPWPGLVTAWTSSTTTSERGRILRSCATTRALASQRLRVEGGRRWGPVSRFWLRAGRRHLRNRLARRIVLRVFTAPLTCDG